MAELVLTDKEKEDKSFTYWDDVSLGKACRSAMLKLKEISEDNERWTIASQACASLLVGRCIDVNADYSVYGFKNFSVSGEEMGDWEVLVRKRMHPLKRLWVQFVNLFHNPEKLTIVQKNKPDGTKESIDVEWKNRKERS